MILPPEEPYFGPWQAVPKEAFVGAIQGKLVGGRIGPGIVAVDGRSAGGKTTLAALLSRNISGAVVVHTDDIAWHHSFFGWSDLLIEGVLGPVRAGQGVSYRPPAWIERGREGAIEVPATCTLLILEGVGAACRELMSAVDVVVWVQADIEQAKTRGLVRDGNNEEAAAFWNEWMAEEFPFLAEQRPWERADFIVSGTPNLKHDPASEVVLAQNPPRVSINAVTSS